MVPNPPDSIDLNQKWPASHFTKYAEVLVPGGYAETLTYGLPQDSMLGRGSFVLISLGKRKEPSLAVILQIHGNLPSFELKPVREHPSGFTVAERFLEMVEWLSMFYGCPPSQCLDVCLPSDLEKLLEKPKRKTTEFSFPHRQEEPPPLNQAQLKVVQQIQPMLDSKGFRGVLLHGITGSGKTRVYLELVQQCLQQGKSVLILVPEIALTPQTRERFQQHLDTEVIVLHSNLSSPERRFSWSRILSGNAKVVLGTRSAILAPCFEPGLVIIDEEHDASYKQHDPSPRYHCRELAFHLAHRHGALVVLGSATPSLESWEYAQRGHLKLVQLLERARPLPLPKVKIIDMRKQSKQDKDLQLSPALREALGETIANGQQAIILHNRRGFATARICKQCGETQECTHCKVALVHHRQHNGLLCHYCGRLYPVQSPCSHCQSREFEFTGGAIEKVEEEILKWIPHAQVLRLDRDSVQNIGAAEKILQDFRDKKANILLGTQMVAKGHDFPDVQLVGVISADIGASLPDFRASERSFQLLTQVAGRAGRKSEGGYVYLQTWNPEDRSLQFALSHDFTGFARWELENRRELGYPPFLRMLAIEMSATNPDLLQQFAQQTAEKLKVAPDIEVLGPAEAYISKIKGQHRLQIILKGSTPANLRKALERAIPAGKKPVQIRIDMDPQSLL